MLAPAHACEARPRSARPRSTLPATPSRNPRQSWLRLCLLRLARLSISLATRVSSTGERRGSRKPNLGRGRSRRRRGRRRRRLTRRGRERSRRRRGKRSRRLTRRARGRSPPRRRDWRGRRPLRRRRLHRRKGRRRRQRLTLPTSGTGIRHASAQQFQYAARTTISHYTLPLLPHVDKVVPVAVCRFRAEPEPAVAVVPAEPRRRTVLI